MPSWKIELIPEAREDFKRLDGNIKVIAIDKREDMEVCRIALKRINSIGEMKR